MAKVVISPGNTVVVSAPGPQGPAGTGGPGGISDGDKGDVVVSNSGSTWTIDTAAVTHQKFQSITGPGLIGRSGAGAGVTERIGLGTGLEIDGSKNLSLTTTPAAASVNLTAGTGLTGGGDLTANRSFAVSFGTSGSTACVGNDARLSDARTPTAHNHAASEITSGTLAIARIPIGTTASDVCVGNDARLSDSRAPTEHTHYAPQSYVGHVETPTARTYYVDLYAPALTITALRFKTSAGTVDVTVYNGASQVYTADGLGTTRTDVTTGLANTAVSAGGTISLVVDAVSSPADLQFVVAYTASTGGVE